MDDHAACADLCEHHGFPAPAAALRALAQGPPPFYLVRALMDPEYAGYEGFDPEDVAPLGRKIFLDRGAAERHAQTLTAWAIRNLRKVHQVGGFDHRYGEDFRREVGLILGVSYQLPDAEGDRLFPDGATDAALLRLGEFMSIELFDVAEFVAEPAPEA